MGQLTERPPTVSKPCLLVIVWLGVVVAIIAVGVRATVQLRYRGRFQPEDVLTGLALLLLIASAIMYTVAVDPLFTLELVGSGLLATPPANFVQTSELFLRLQFAITLTFWTCLWIVKASFLILFYPLSDGLRVDRIWWYAVAVFVGLAYIACVISYPIACHDFTLGGCQTDDNIRLVGLSLRMTTAVDIISDALIIFLPWKLLWVVQLSRREKIAIGSIVGLGVLIILFAIIRVILTNSTNKNPEPVWLALWSSIETTVAVIVISMTSLKVLLNRSHDPPTTYGSRDDYHSHVSRTTDSNRERPMPLGDVESLHIIQPHMADIKKGSSSNESQEILVE